MSLIYRLFGNHIKRKLAEGAYRPKDFTGLSFAFTDTQGHAYYTWANVGDMPPSRIKQVEALMRQAEEGMSRKDIESIGKEIKRVVMEQALPAKGAAAISEANARIVVLADELTKRTGIIPEDVFYDLAATCAVREDEEPASIDRIIHVDKFTTFQSAGRAGLAFFTPLPTFNALLSASVTTEEGFVRLLTSWTKTRGRTGKVMEAIASPTGSAATAKTSTGSPSALRAARPKATTA